MESKTIKKIRSGKEYDHLFPKATLADDTIKRGATVSDTVQFIPQVVRATLFQTKNIAPLLKGRDVYETCKNIWHFLYEHVKYRKDEDGFEQIRSPARLWHDRFLGVDCDCFTTTVLSLLAHCNINNAIMRITKYKQNHFQHIYPIVPIGNGKYITVDCVVDEFNYEEPYTEKKDFKMDLQYLNGVEETGSNNLSGNVDAQDLFGWNDEMGDLGKLFKKRQSSSAMPEENQGGKKGKKGFQKFKNIAKKVLNVTNKVNPATAVLRAGILASMKVNIMKVAEKLKWAYLSEDEARKKGADMSKFAKLKKVLYKIEQIFYTAGGKPENLKKAILSGRGNRHHEVSGLGLIDSSEIQIYGFDENTPLSSLLGEVYHDEFVNGLEGTEGLGVIATSASIAAASTVMGTIAALLKSIGSLFPKKGGGGEGGSGDGGSGDGGSGEGGGGDENSEPNVNVSSGDDNSSDENKSSPPAMKKKNTPATNDDSGDDGGGNSEDNTNGTGSNAKKSADTTDDEQPKGLKGFWENNKKWIKPVGIGVAVAGVIYAGYRMIKGGKEKEKKPASNGQAALNGFNSRKHKKRKKGKRGGNNGKKSSIALM